MFRKPKQRNLRGRTDIDNTEDDQSNVSNAPSTVIQQQTVTTKTVIKKTEVPKSLLSFGDDEGDTEEFKVNKTRESRKMAKEVKKQQQQLHSSSIDSKPNVVIQQTTTTTSIIEETITPKEENNNNGEIQIKFKPLQIIGNKSSTNSFTSSNADLQRLRKEMKVLNGPEGDIPDLDDIQEILEGNDDEDDRTLDDTERSVKVMLRSGVIPDSTMIHAARKRRQMAREMGVPGDYISLNTAAENGNDRKSRLVRDDENDASDDSGNEDPHIVSMDRNKTRAESERQKNRDRFLELEQGSDNEEDEEEFRRFEREQIRKGVSSKISTMSAIKTLASSSSKSQVGVIRRRLECNSSVQLSQSQTENSSSSLVEPQPMEVEVIRELPPLELPPVTFDHIRDRLLDSLKSIKELNEKHKIDYEKVNQAYEVSQLSLQQNTIDYPQMEKSYQFYQQCRAYVYSFLECYNEKMVTIINLEERWLQLYKQRADMIVTRRQEDFKDQCHEYSIQKATAFINGTLTTNDFRTVLDQKRQRRATEREARRLRRRKDREQTSTQHFDGMSTDDEENQSDINLFLKQKQEIITEAEHLLDDVSDEFSQYKNIKTIFEQWKYQQNETYTDAFIEICLPKVFSPLIRREIIDWKPFETSCRAIEDYNWYQNLLFYGVKDGRNEDEDFQFIPLIIEKVIIPKLTNIIAHIYDPLSLKQTTNLVKTIENIFQTYPTMTDDSKNVQNLLKAIVDRLQRSLDDDIYIPLYPKEIIALGSSRTSSNNSAIMATEFFFRQYWTCVKLLGNITLWSQILSLKTILDLSIDGLLNRYILVSLKNMDLISNEMITRCLLLAKCFPIKQWFDNNKTILQNQLTDTTLPALENFCLFLKQLAQEYSTQIFSANDKDKKIYKENIRQIRVIFVHLHALDHALELTNEYEIK
ncbi:unnamed protein product [Rotaria sp. Silwood1]|nr:unnamed protein product [Rotaria sp. Silwood1]CAF3471760.1 unnamed protein product [Rotaria sp. Silwood1]CAF4573306.1 unnamed protein product [Rotaria sp. Silwood1]CAF4649157.1 unnamed protein product [Rotaria sp. Silwood1]